MRTPLYKLAPVTASTAEFLAETYGHSSINDYVESLPLGARILDVGAGNSELGRVVAELRPDISWTNMDISYGRDELTVRNEGVPVNLKYINGDILDTQKLSKNTYDLIYAFWVLPHIGLEHPSLVKQALQNILAMLKDDSKSRLVVGPLMRKRIGKASNKYATTELFKVADETRLVEMAQDCTALPKQAAELRAMNRAGVTTMKNRRRTGQEPSRSGLWDYKSKQYVKAISARGILLMLRYRMYLVVEIMKQNLSSP